MQAATEERAEETTVSEEEIKAETEREEALLRQIEAESTLCDDPTWRNKQLKRLKLYNNQARDTSKVGDPLLFTVFQTVFAALYEDRLSVEFEGNDEGDKDTVRLDESSINAFMRDDNYVYVQAGDYGRWYFYNGEQLLPYTRVPGEWSPTKTAKVNPSAVAFLLGVPVFGLSNVAGNPALQGVYSLGSYSKDYAKVLDLSFPVSSGAFSGLEIGAVAVKGGDMLVAWKDADGAGVDKLDYAAKYASAYIETMMLSKADKRGILKTALEACAYYASLPVSTGITFAYKKNYAADYTAMTPQTDSKLSAVTAKESIPEVANMQLKFGFTVNGNHAPEVEDFDYKLAA